MQETANSELKRTSDGQQFNITVLAQLLWGDEVVKDPRTDGIVR
jgi:hypothetical protein